MPWYVAYPISYRQLEEMMEERGGKVDHRSLNRWVIKYVLLLDQAFPARKRAGRAINEQSPGVTGDRFISGRWPESCWLVVPILGLLFFGEGTPA